MKKLIFFITVLGMSFSITSCVKTNPKTEKIEQTENQYNFKTAFTKVFENSKSYTLEVAEAMPAEDYNFKTTDSVRTFGEQLAHIGISSQFILEKLIKGKEIPETDITEQQIGASKEMTIELLTKSFDAVISSLNSMDDATLNEKFVLFFLPEKPTYAKHEGFVFLRDHITHHRGQAIVYLRIKGHKAPQYRAF